MMKLKKSNPAQMLKLAFVLPLAAVAVAAFASQRVENISERVEEESSTLVPMKENPVENPVAVKAVDAAVADTAVCGNKAEKFFVNPETMPEFPGGQMAFIEYLSKNVKYPESEINSGVDARVVVTFTVNKDGSISDAKVTKSQGEAFDSEALRIVKGMPNWTPATLCGKPVTSKYTLPVRFSTKSIGKVVKSVKAVDLGTEKQASDKRMHLTANDYVIVVDGKPMENINAIRPSDIKSIDVKNDDETKKKYNAEGKQGVMIVKTK